MWICRIAAVIKTHKIITHNWTHHYTNASAAWYRKRRARRGDAKKYVNLHRTHTRKYFDVRFIFDYMGDAYVHKSLRWSLIKIIFYKALLCLRRHSIINLLCVCVCWNARMQSKKHTHAKKTCRGFFLLSLKQRALVCMCTTLRIFVRNARYTDENSYSLLSKDLGGWKATARGAKQRVL